MTKCHSGLHTFVFIFNENRKEKEQKKCSFVIRTLFCVLCLHPRHVIIGLHHANQNAPIQFQYLLLAKLRVALLCCSPSSCNGVKQRWTLGHVGCVSVRVLHPLKPAFKGQFHHNMRFYGPGMILCNLPYPRNLLMLLQSILGSWGS